MQENTPSELRLPVMITCLLGIFVLVLVSCGQREPTIAESFQAYPIATPTPTATIHPLDATKQADDERIERELATAEALPTPITRPPTPTVPTPLPLETGLLSECETAYDGLVIPSNCWLDIFNNEYVVLFAGKDPNNHNQGKIGFYTVSLDETVISDFLDFPTPSEHGAIRIINITVPRFTVTAEDGTRFVFNLDTRTWEDPPPYP
ncbi:MAG: hypothetical protein GFH27_549423n52 [Chloroflexi bacterium AL-W]|nr:hypothetical protein [Chloroflexi bacterium AL-N1]NOK71556.1 hypothetical protein [Chloroflexi bacterium AL-N10]NOK78902.1 hypothetical protein [Chloroflexi bacterium AL-N5]NOK86378.1 hypothetical protein [Chloroflexi bacterium AL-W]NOK93347.1 hypothetical protein [Chloroflexi bacterium AL-N15]